MKDMSDLQHRITLAIYNDLAYIYALVRNMNSIIEEGYNLDEEEFGEYMREFKEQVNRGLRAIADDPDRVLQGKGAYVGAPDA